MKINTNAWHYRYLKAWGFAGRSKYDYESDKYVLSGPKSLCTYFWTLVVTLAATAVGGIIVLGLLSGAVIVGITHPLVGIFVVSISVCTAAVLALIRWKTDEINAYLDRQAAKPTKEPKPKTPNLFWEFIKAKKLKVCPLIEYTNE